MVAHFIIPRIYNDKKMMFKKNYAQQWFLSKKIAKFAVISRLLLQEILSLK
jgi:hypothetical protein